MKLEDELTLIVEGQRLNGWVGSRLTRGIERCPSDFSVSLTEKYPNAWTNVLVVPGQSFQAVLGNDLVVTGYIDRVTPSFGPTSHSLSISGRGKCQDLVDCAAEWPGGQIRSSTVLDIASKLASVYGISVSCTGDPAGVIPQFNLMLGTSAFETIERICRYKGLLVYDAPDGNLVLGAVGTQRAASGFQEGVNVETARIAFSIDQRFSEYVALIQSVDVFEDTGSGGNLYAKVEDNTVTRHRRHVIICDSSQSGLDIATRTANWERVRRYGRSSAVTLTTDSWRDSSGALYSPNTIAALSLPSLKLDGESWLISEVTYRKDAAGTHADITMMPPEAFIPQPIVLQPVLAEIDRIVDR